MSLVADNARVEIIRLEAQVQEIMKKRSAGDLNDSEKREVERLRKKQNDHKGAVRILEHDIESLEGVLRRKKKALKDEQASARRTDDRLIVLNAKQARLRAEGSELSRADNNELIRLRGRQAELNQTLRLLGEI